jgi:hypothetical protein
MTEDEIKALVERLRDRESFVMQGPAFILRMGMIAADALEAITLENERLRADAERYRWSTATEDNASTLHSILLCHAGDQAKIDARVDEYMKEEPQ